MGKYFCSNVRKLFCSNVKGCWLAAAADDGDAVGLERKSYCVRFQHPVSAHHFLVASAVAWVRKKKKKKKRFVSSRL